MKPARDFNIKVMPYRLVRNSSELDTPEKLFKHQYIWAEIAPSKTKKDIIVLQK